MIENSQLNKTSQLCLPNTETSSVSTCHQCSFSAPFIDSSSLWDSVRGMGLIVLKAISLLWRMLTGWCQRPLPMIHRSWFVNGVLSYWKRTLLYRYASSWVKSHYSRQLSITFQLKCVFCAFRLSSWKQGSKARGHWGRGWWCARYAVSHV